MSERGGGVGNTGMRDRVRRKDPGRYERVMALYLLIALGVSVGVALADRRLLRPLKVSAPILVAGLAVLSGD